MNDEPEILATIGMHRRFSTLPEKLHGYYLVESLEQAFITYCQLQWRQGRISLIDIQKIELMLLDAHPAEESSFCIFRVSFKNHTFFYDVCQVLHGDLDPTTAAALTRTDAHTPHIFDPTDRDHVLEHLENMYPDPTAYLYDPELNDTFTLYGSDLLMHLVDHCEP